ncbi:MAG: hypothetical protein EXR62_16925 [Chloroflexi bacterium]|nr:hypothetical protein [Chloroflexota bacterium]
MEVKVRYQDQIETVEVASDQIILTAVKKAQEKGLQIPEHWSALHGRHTLLKTHFLALVGIKEGDIIDISPN